VNVRTILRECAVDLLDTEPQVTIGQVVNCAYRRHGDAFNEAAEAMILAAAKDIVRDVLRDLSEDEEAPEQLSLDGMAFPSAIAVATPDGTYYVRTDKATWPELEAGRSSREHNVAAALAKLDAYDE
jgi:hypothetical protein